MVICRYDGVIVIFKGFVRSEVLKCDWCVDGEVLFLTIILFFELCFPSAEDESG